MVKLITVATHNELYMPWLIKSCQRYNTQITILGWEQKWLGFKWRYELMIDYLNCIDENEIICFIDAYDVLLLRPLDELEEIYNKIGKKIIISSENVVNNLIEFVFGQLKNSYFSLCDKKRVNAGLYVSKAKYLKDILNDLLNNYDKPEYHNDDQIMITKHCNNNKDLYYIDTKFEIFLTIFNPMFSGKNNKIKIKNQQLYYGDYRPFFIHGNGNTRLDDIILELGYDMNNKSIKDTKIHNINTVLLKKIPTYTYLYLKPYFVEIIFIVILLILLYRISYDKKS